MWATRPSVNLASTVICTLPLGTVASATRIFPRRGRSRTKATLFARRAVVSKVNVAIGCGSRATAKVIIFLVSSMSTVASS